MSIESAKMEREPTINVHFYFGPHASIGDFEKMKSLFKEADVYCPELSGWRAETEELFNRISQGEDSLSELKRKIQLGTPQLTRLYGSLADMMYGSQKLIVFIDEPSGGKSRQIYEKSELKYESAREAFMRGDFELFMQFARNMIQLRLQANSAREAAIARNLEATIREKILQSDSLRTKTDINVLVSLGIAHTPVAREAQSSESSTVSSHLSQSPFVFTHESEIERRLRAGIGVPDELYGQAGIEWVIQHAVQVFDLNKINSIRVARFLSDSLDLDECRTICKSIYPIRFKSKSVKHRALLAELEKHGISMPKNPEEYEALLKKITAKDTVNI